MQKATTRPNGTLKVQTVGFEPTLTQQQFKDECDINTIMKKYGNNMDLVEELRQADVFVDLVGIPDYQQMQDTLIAANEAFDALGAELRYKRFNNDPKNLISFLNDPKNYDEGVKLGLLNPKPKQQPDPSANNDKLNDDKLKGSKPKKTTTTIIEET